MVIGTDMQKIEERSHHIGGINPIKTDGRRQDGYPLGKLHCGDGSQGLEAATVC
jgi:hypothetical protein